MRFRGKIVTTACIQALTRVLASLSKMCKSCVLRINKTTIYFIMRESPTNGGTALWCELDKDNYFDEYGLDGFSDEHDEIFLEILPENLLQCVKMSQSINSLKIKLTKKVMACLTFEVEQLGGLLQGHRTVIHDVPVVVIPQRSWSDYDAPSIPEFDVSLQMPQVRLFKHALDRLKNISHHLNLSANQNGDMHLDVESTVADVHMHYCDLKRPSYADESGQPGRLISVRLDIRRLTPFIGSLPQNPQRFLCNIVENKIIHFFVLHEDASFQYFIPAIEVG